MPTLIGDMEFRALLMFMALASISGLVTGAVLIVRPDWLARLGKYTNRWISTRKLDKTLEHWISLDKWFYLHHRASGGLMLAGAVWVIVFFITPFNKHQILVDMTRSTHVSTQLMDWLLDTFVLAGIAGGVFALLVSLFLLLRPSLLRDLEQGTNQWLSLRKTLKPVEIPRSGLDEYVFRNVRLVGILLLLGSVYILAGLMLGLR